MTIRRVIMSHCRIQSIHQKSPNFIHFGLNRTPITLLHGCYKGSAGPYEENKITGGMKGIKEAMTLHHLRHSPLQKNLWCNNTKLTFLNSSAHAPYRSSLWRGSLRSAGSIFVVTTIILHTTTTIIFHSIRCAIVVSGRG
jgi:hypothetical protein